VIDPHFVTFSRSLYTTIRDPNPNPNPNTNPNRNPTAITNRQIVHTNPQIVAVQIRPTDSPRSACCRVPTMNLQPGDSEACAVTDSVCVRSNGHSSGGPGLTGTPSILDFIGAKDDGDGGENWSL